jgi:hypothetical protein
MKKFGTPNGAGPGTENENVGFAAVGTPLLVLAAGGFGADFGALDDLGPVGPVPLFPVGPLGPLVPLPEPEP